MKNGNEIYAKDRRQSPAFEPNYSQESRQKMSQQLEDKLQLNPNPSYKSNYQYKQDYQPNPYSQLNPNIYKPIPITIQQRIFPKTKTLPTKTQTLSPTAIPTTLAFSQGSKAAFSIASTIQLTCHTAVLQSEWQVAILSATDRFHHIAYKYTSQSFLFVQFEELYS